MILVDTSAWIEYLRATGSRVALRLRELVESDGPIATTEPVIMELAAGARTNDQEAQLRRLLARFELIPFDPASDFDGAVRLYRTCRRQGGTPTGLIDCQIANVAWRSGASLLARDSDLELIAEVAGIPLDAR